jgi:hypothetical protein
MVPAAPNGPDPSSLFMIVLGSLLTVWTCFTDKVPEKIRNVMTSTLGRLLAVVLLYTIYSFLGFLPALLFTMAISLTWLNRPLTKPVEGFLSSIKKTQVQGDKWFVEDTLGENPVAIMEDRVVTQAVQDNSDSKNTKSSR